MCSARAEVVVDLRQRPPLLPGKVLSKETYKDADGSGAPNARRRRRRGGAISDRVISTALMFLNFG